MTLSPWLLAARPKTLPAAIVPVWVGAMPSVVDRGPMAGSGWLFLCTLASCLCIQIATNFFNDAIDHKRGSDTEDRLGPKRVTATGMLSQKAVMRGAFAFCVLAALFAIPLIEARGWPVVAIGAVSLFFAYGYTGGPYPLAYRGMGEVFVIVFFGFVAVLGSHFIQTGTVGGAPIWILALQCGLYSGVLIAINNLRDIDEDRKTGKKTLAVRIGKTFARWEIASFCFVALVLWWPFLSFFPGEYPSQAIHRVPDRMMLAGLFLSFCFAILVSVKVFRNEPSSRYNGFLALSAVQLLIFGALATAFFLSI